MFTALRGEKDSYEGYFLLLGVEVLQRSSPTRPNSETLTKVQSTCLRNCASLMRVKGRIYNQVLVFAEGTHRQGEGPALKLIQLQTRTRVYVRIHEGAQKLPFSINEHGLYLLAVLVYGRRDTRASL